MQHDRHDHLELNPRAEPDPDPGTSDQLDLLSIGLAVFFIALIAIVAAMLLLPRIVSGG